MLEIIARWLKRLGIGGGIALFVAYAVFWAWSLPSHVKVRITGTETARSDVHEPDKPTTIHDVRYVMTEGLDGTPRMFRNEDTGWGWPPYFKFDTGDVAAQAQAHAMEKSEPVVVLTYYGFRVPMFSAFPNVLRMKVVEPDYQPIPWLTITFVFAHIVLAGVAVAVFRDFKRAREERAAS